MKFLVVASILASASGWSEFHSDVGVRVHVDSQNATDKAAFLAHLKAKFQHSPKRSGVSAPHRRHLFTGTAINDGGGFSQDEKQSLLDNHNDFRSTVAEGDTPGQPSATGMNMLFWDDTLAAVAQAYAERCIWAHNTDPSGDFVQVAANIVPSFAYDADELAIGENLYVWSDDGALVDGSIRTETFMLSGVTAWCVSHFLSDNNIQHDMH